MALRIQLHRFLNDPTHPWASAMEWLTQILIVLSVLVFTVSTLPGLPHPLVERLSQLEFLIISVFVIEYGLRVYAAPERLRFMFSFYGLIDLMAVFPYFLFSGLDTTSLRLFRLIRIFKFFRYSRALNLLIDTFQIVKNEALILGTTALILFYMAGVGIYFLENEAQPEKFASVLDGLWWALSTLTTVGYGDSYPITPLGKLFTFFVLVLGLGVVGGFTGVVASGMNEARRIRAAGEHEPSKRVN